MNFIHTLPFFFVTLFFNKQAKNIKIDEKDEFYGTRIYRLYYKIISNAFFVVDLLEISKGKLIMINIFLQQLATRNIKRFRFYFNDTISYMILLNHVDIRVLN